MIWRDSQDAPETSRTVVDDGGGAVAPVGAPGATAEHRFR